jgi:DNA-binding beta-propeller fold protein YncE
VSDLVVSSDGKHVYASRNGADGGDIAVLDTATDRVDVVDLAPGVTTECVRISSDGGRLYVGTNGPTGGQLVVFGADAPSEGRALSRWRRKNPKQSTRSTGNLRVIDTVGIGLPIRDVALSRDGSVAYVASICPELDPESSVVVDVIDTRDNKIVNTSKIDEISGILTGLTLSGDGDRAYLVTDDGVTVLCTRTHDVVGTLGCALQPSAVVESPDGKFLYIADYSGTVSVVPIASKTPLAIESAANDNNAAADWDLPALLQYEPALA